MLSVAVCGCSQTVSAPSSDDESAEGVKTSSSSKGGKQADSAKSSSSAETPESSGSEKSSSSVAPDVDLDENCTGEAGKPWDGTTAKDFACGAGTKLSPYVILTAEQLAHLSFVVGANDADYQGKYYRLGADILLNEGEIIDDKGALVADSAKLHKWTPIGNSSVSFSGNFDGAGHTVSGMFINTTSTHNGLFGDNQGNISNLEFSNSWIQGGKYTAGIAGHNGGSITNVTNNSTITGTGDYVGGIVGQSNGPYPNYAQLKDVQNNGVIKGSNYVGSIAGNAYQTSLSNSSNTAYVSGKKYVGGIAGQCGYHFINYYRCIVENAINSADISGSQYVGGIAGETYRQSSLTQVINQGEISGINYVGGISGHGTYATVEQATNKSSVLGEKYVAGIFGYIENSTTSSLYNTGDIFGTEYVGGVFGHNKEGVTRSAYITGKVDGDSLVGLVIGLNYNTTMADYYYLEQGDKEPFGLNDGGGVATPKTEDEMKSADFASLLGDDFVYDSGLNGGFPALSFEKE